MSVFNRVDVKKEFLNFLRNSDVFNTTTRGVTTITDSGTTANTGAETITLSETDVRNIRSVTYDSSLLSYGSDYTIDIDNNQVTILVVVPTKPYAIQFDAGSTDKIYPDYPRPNLKIGDYPRLGFDIYGQTSIKAGFGNVNKISFRFMINIYAATNKAGDDYLYTLRTKIIDAQTSLYHISYMYPLNVIQAQPIETNNKNNKIFMASMDVEIDNLYEIN